MDLNKVNIEKLPADVRKTFKQMQLLLAEKKIQNKAKNDFLSFVKCVWPDFVEGSHHRHIADKFNKLASGEINRLIINMPPRHTKSEFASYLLPAWMVGREPRLKIIQATHTGELAIRFGRKAKNLIDATYESLNKAINILKPGIKLGDIGHQIQSYVEEKGFSVVRDFCGHGISNTFHESPNILHYGKKNTGLEVYPGMTFTIEPMINVGKYDVKILNDGWTAVTKDKSLSAQFEHTVGITENGYEIFTESVKGYNKPPY
mgnify:CR=1 FL=1